jgi:hypothetical protein
MLHITLECNKVCKTAKIVLLTDLRLWVLRRSVLAQRMVERISEQY